MRRAIVAVSALLLVSVSGVSACHHDPNLPTRSAHELAREQQARHASQAALYQGMIRLDPEQRAYAHASRERLRLIQERAEQLKQNRQTIPPESQGDAAATLNLLPSKCDETERDIAALEIITSHKWQQRKGQLDRKLANLERSLDRAQAR